MSADEFIARLEGVRSRGGGKWLARCPAHADRNPSLSIKESQDRILVRCWAGCTSEEIVKALGLGLGDLFLNPRTDRRTQSAPNPRRIDLSDVAFRFELGALDRRLRADAVLQAVANCSGDALRDEDRDRLLNVVARAYADRDRADFLETIADDLRVRAFQRKEYPYAAA